MTVRSRSLRLAGSRYIDLSGPAAVMAIINLTEDSFYAPSRSGREEAVKRALEAEAAGAAIVDFGGESTRPGAAYVGAEEELERVVPVVELLRRSSAIPISVDTRKASVARAALDAGADIINDVSALGDDPLLAPLCAEKGAAVILMHKKGIPANMQDAPHYDDVVSEVLDALLLAARKAGEAGIANSSIALDPGFGFGKRLVDNLDLIARLAEISDAGYPVLVGLSRKSFIGKLTGKPVEDRLAGTLAATAAAVAGGARIIRTHDVAETVDLVRVLWEIAERTRLGAGVDAGGSDSTGKAE